MTFLTLFILLVLLSLWATFRPARWCLKAEVTETTIAPWPNVEFANIVADDRVEPADEEWPGELNIPDSQPAGVIELQILKEAA